MALEGQPYSDITKLVGISATCISTWKQRFLEVGLAGIQLNYKGRRAYLTPEQRKAVIAWLQSENQWHLEELANYIDEHYEVVYQSKQSYYDLFTEAGISWKKSQKVNPKRDEEAIEKKRKEIVEFIEGNRLAIESGELIVYFVDECHLIWGDVCGYIWGKMNERIEIPIENEKNRQTYYGALNYQTKEFVVQSYEAGNGANTVHFIQFLQARDPQQKLAVLWDGVTHHTSGEFKIFLAQLNDGVEESEWRLKCILFAPNAPEQNPVEDVWLQAKNFLRKFWTLCKSFQAVKWLFSFFAIGEKFDFKKLEKYTSAFSSI